MRQVIRKLRLSSLLPMLAIFALVTSTAHAAIFEFNPVIPVVGVDAPYNRLPPPPEGPQYPAGHIYGDGVQIKDGYGGQNLPDGLDAINTLNFVVDDVNTPITRVEVLLSLYHPHLNDLDVSLQSPSGITVPLIRGISQPNAPIVSRAIGGGYQYIGSIGGRFSELPSPPGFNGYYDGTPLTPVTLVSQLDEDDITGGLTVPYINDPAILDQRPTSNTYLNTVPPGTYFSQGDLRLFNGLSGDGKANGTWRLKVVDQKQNNFITVDGAAQYVYYLQAVLYAQIIIHQEGGYKVWVGNGANDNWTDVNNWAPENGAPTADQPVSLVFPASSLNEGDRYTAINNFPVNLRIADISVVNGTQNYIINMNGVTFYKRCRIQNNGGSNVINFTAGQTQSTGRIKIDVQSGDIALNGPISGLGGIKKLGDGLGILNGANSFTGTSIVEDGILRLLTPTALGSGAAASGTTIRNSGILQLGGLGDVAEPLLLAGNGTGAGAINITANQTMTGEIAIQAGATGVKVDAGTLVLNDFNQTLENGLTNFIVQGGGTLSLADPAPANVNQIPMFPQHTAVTVIGSVLATNVNQPNLGNLVLSAGTVTGTGTLFPRNLKGFLNGVSDDIDSSGTSSIANPINFAAGSRSIAVNSGTLTASGVISNGSLTKRGGGTLALTANSAPLAVAVAGGVLSGNGTIGALSVAKGGALNPGGTFTVASATFAPQSAFIVEAGDQLASSGGNVSLGGRDLDGIGGAVLQPYVGATGTIITGPNTGAFEGLSPRDNGIQVASTITYNANTVVLGAAGGPTVWFDPSSYSVNESAGSLTVTTVWSAGPGDAILRHFGGQAVRDYNLRVGADDDSVPVGLTKLYTVQIIQNYVDTGDISTTLGLVPLGTARLALPINLTAPAAPVATLRIRDDDKTDQNACGFGTGLTVFLLLGFGLLLNVRLRRR